jgi:hypothetical protein
MQVETVSMKAGMEDWEMNFIQGMVNQLQIDFRSLKPSSKNTRTQINTSYKMMEVRVHRCLPVQFCQYREPKIFDTNITLVPIFSEVTQAFGSLGYQHTQAEIVTYHHDTQRPCHNSGD